LEQSGRKERKRKINEGGACRLIRNDVSVNRHINFQSVFFPFFLFFSSQYTIYIYFVYDVVQLELACSLLEHEQSFFLLLSLKMLCVVLDGEGERDEGGEWRSVVERETRKKGRKKMKRGRLGKAKENQYMSDKKAQILGGSSV
jgi:hypothetical protein